jgi:apolipoprotein N-acyltransferase
MTSGTRVWVPAALVSSAVLFFFGTGLAGEPIAALTWLAPLPVLLLAPRVPAPVALGVAFLASLLGTTNSWSFYLHSQDMPLGPGLLCSVALSLMFTLAVGVFRGLLRRTHPLAGAVVSAATWTAAAYLVQVLNPMGLMGTFANDQGSVPVVVQIASVTGPWGVEFLVLFVPAAVAALCAPGVATAARWRTAVAGAAVLALALGYGAVRLAEDTAGPARRVALVVHNQAGWGVAVSTPAGRDLVAAYTAEVAALPAGVRTAVLPEGAFTVDDTSLPALVGPLSQAARSRGMDVVVGYTRLAGGEKYQTALTVPADGSAPVAYLKHHDRVSPTGHALALPPVAGTRMGVAICGDLDFADPSRAYARAGAALLAVPASDNDDNGWVHSRLVALRSVENGVALAWSARKGQPALVDSHGRVLADAHTGGPNPFTTVVADVPTGPGATPYTALGDWFAWLCLVLALGGVIALYPKPTPEQTRAAPAAQTTRA